jgi:hypothetical protein
MFGRSAFFIHGDSRTRPGTASNGCIILSRPTRTAIDRSDDKVLVVVRDAAGTRGTVALEAAVVQPVRRKAAKPTRKKRAAKKKPAAKPARKKGARKAAGKKSAPRKRTATRARAKGGRKARRKPTRKR